ncbi:MAG: glycerol-3-phosphate dehydrogenase [Dehalococcoidales bacterium]|nr:glycerol-3-phosphate dehydrogenase [Dehalococcoidales bacterium]
MNLKRDFDALSKESFDLIVIGGGIIGAGIARDAALRGFKTLLLEKEDFGWGTTSRSTRLLHGGLRYLRQFQFKLVREDLKEREILLRIAPHLSHRLPFIIPLLRSQPLYRLSLPFGMKLYQMLSSGKDIPAYRHLSRSDVSRMEPELGSVRDLTGGYLYYDAEVELMERLCVENVISAEENGARVLNHTLVTGLTMRSSTVEGVEVQDNLTGEKYQVKGRLVFNAGGPWADLVWEKMNLSATNRLRRTKGVHLLTDKVSTNALVLFARSDGRLFFVIPWQDYSLIGTTDTDYTGDPDTVHAGAEDVNYLVNEVRHYFPAIKQESIHYAFAGLRPLVASGSSKASNTSRAHRLIDHSIENGIEGFLSVLGGKITAYRGVAEESVDLIARKLGSNARCTTAETALPGAPAVLPHALKLAAQENSIPAATAAHLARIYGSRFAAVLALAKKDTRLAQPLGEGCPDILAQVHYAVNNEYALTVGDFLLRRTDAGLRPDQGRDAAFIVTQEMGRLLGWDSATQQRQLETYRSAVDLMRLFRKQIT